MPLEIIQEIGSYAGLAAVLGLAVLSALYFSQARDVKRLREWAGRAPERTAEGPVQAAPRPDAQPGRVVAQPQTKPAAAAGAKPATATQKPAAATAAGQAAQQDGEEDASVPPEGEPAVAAGTGRDGEQDGAADERTDPDEERQAGDDAREREGDGSDEEREAVGAQAASRPGGMAQAGAAAPPAGAPVIASGGAAAPPVPAGAPAAPSTPAGGAAAPSTGAAAPSTPAGGPAPSTPAGGSAPSTGAGGAAAPPRPPARPQPGARPGGPAPPVPRTGGGPALRPGAPRPSQTAIIPPAARPPWYRRLLASPRYLVLVIAGVLILGGGAAFGVVQLSDDGGVPSERSASPEPSDEGDGGSGQSKKPGAVNPKKVTVSVLNGTTVPGLAAQLGDKIEGFGFQLGNVTNSTDQQRAESAVLFAPGNEREAIAVARKLRIGQRERIDAQTQGLAGDAAVVVIAGIDQTR